MTTFLCLGWYLGLSSVYLNYPVGAVQWIVSGVCRAFFSWKWPLVYNYLNKSRIMYISLNQYGRKVPGLINLLLDSLFCFQVLLEYCLTSPVLQRSKPSDSCELNVSNRALIHDVYVISHVLLDWRVWENTKTEVNSCSLYYHFLPLCIFRFIV